jgi:hypothetical protein
MTTLTVNIQNEKDLSSLQEVLDRVGIDYEAENYDDYVFSKEEIERLVKDNEDYINGKTTARDWNDIKEDLKRAFN